MKLAEVYKDWKEHDDAQRQELEARWEREFGYVKEDLAKMGITEEDGWTLTRYGPTIRLGHPPQLPREVHLQCCYDERDGFLYPYVVAIVPTVNSSGTYNGDMDVRVDDAQAMLDLLLSANHGYDEGAILNA